MNENHKGTNPPRKVKRKELLFRLPIFTPKMCAESVSLK